VIKLLLLIPTLDRSGAEKQFSLLATRLPKDQFDVHAVALTRSGPYEKLLREHNIPLTVLGKRWKFDPFCLLRLKRLISRINPDIVHSWLFAANAAARLVAGKKPNPKVIVSERCVDSWKSGWQLRLDRRQIGRTTKLIGNSAGVADFYAKQGVPRDKIVVIPNGVSFPSGKIVDRDSALAEFDIPPGAGVVGFVGRLAPQKRVKDLIWATQLLRQITNGVYFLVVGDGPEREQLMALAQHVGCDHLVRFVGHRDDVSKLMPLMNVFWLASDFEGMSNSILEAMAAGVPVVASDIPPNRELVIDGETGFLVKAGDSVGYAQFADRLLADRELWDRLSNASRKRVETEFSIEKMVEAHAALYRQVVEGIA